MVDMAHYAGLIAAGVYPTRCLTPTWSPRPRTRACAARGGIILMNNEASIAKAKKINSAIFPGIQGGPLMHVIAAKAVAFKGRRQPEFNLPAASGEERRRRWPTR